MIGMLIISSKRLPTDVGPERESGQPEIPEASSRFAIQNYTGISNPRSRALDLKRDSSIFLLVHFTDPIFPVLFQELKESK